MIDSERREGPGEPRLCDERRQKRDEANKDGLSELQVSTLARQSLFADNTRFWSMIGILGLHSAQTVATLISDHRGLRALGMLEALEKFGTIGFFFTSGFLLGERFETAKASTFLGRRLKKICAPWLVWLVIMVTSMVAAQCVMHEVKLGLNLTSFHHMLSMLMRCLLWTPFWFVPNLFLSVCFLMIFRRFLRSLWLGSCLLIVTAFYAANIYTAWIPSSHTTALGGYIFFLWAGAYVARNYGWAESKLNRLPVFLMMVIVGLLWFLSLLESKLVWRLRSADSQNTLRFSNILFSLAVILLLMKLRRVTWPAFIDVRNQMFGVYLSHSLVLFILLRLTSKAEPVQSFFLSHHGIVLALGSAILVTIAVFSVCLIITRQIACRRRIAWLVGDTSRSVPLLRNGRSRRPDPTFGFVKIELEQKS